MGNQLISSQMFAKLILATVAVAVKINGDHNEGIKAYFTARDVNKDGCLQVAEIDAEHREFFGAANKDLNDCVTIAEVDTFLVANPKVANDYDKAQMAAHAAAMAANAPTA